MRESLYETPKSEVQSNENIPYTPRMFSLRGRIGRLRYVAYSFLFNFVFMFFMGIVAAIVIPSIAQLNKGSGDLLISLVVLGLYLPMIIYLFIAMVRRLNDLNLTGWLSLIIFIPIVNMLFALYLLCWPGSPEENNYGPKPEPNSPGIIIVGIVLPLFVIVGLAAVAIPAYNDFKMRAQQSVEKSAAP